MIFARQLERLRQAAAVGMPGCPPGKVTVDVRDLRELLHHFDRIDAELRAIHQAPESHPDDGIRFRKLLRHHKSTNGVFCIAELVGFDDSGNAEWAAVDGDLRSLLDRIQAEACDSQTTDSEAQAGLCRNDEAQECDCNVCHKEKLAANPPADRIGSLMALASRGMVLCPTCGNKRCPHANDHRNACTGSNEPGQAGSSYPDVTIIRLGVYGRAFDGPQTRRAYTYQHQPENLHAAKLGRAAASTSPGGDCIDHGLSLLKELQAHGFGVFELGDQQEGGA